MAETKSNSTTYRNTETGQTWSGKGQKPAWVREALAAGRSLEELPDTTVAAPSIKTDPGNYQELDIDFIAESPFNPRKTFNEDALQELAQNIRELGVLQPIRVRPGQIKVSDHPESDSCDGYQIVFGHRRFRAAQLAGLRTIPAMVSELTDLECARLQAVENLQREDLDPFEEAEGYAEYIKTHGVTKQDLATHIDKSRTYVYNRLKLASLCEAARVHVRSGALDAELAIEIARLATEELQIEALAAVTQYNWDKEAPPKFVSFRDGRNTIEAKYKRHLKDAIFDRQVIFLVADRPDCQSCPDRAENMVELNATGKRADVCTLPSCFNAKTQAHLAIAATEAEKLGGKVITGSDAAKLFCPWDISKLDDDDEYAALDQTLDELDDDATPRDALGKKLKPADVVHIVNQVTGKVHQAVAKDLLVKHKLIEAPELEVSDGAKGSAAENKPPADTRTAGERKADEAREKREVEIFDRMRAKAIPRTFELIRSASRQAGDVTAILWALFRAAEQLDDYGDGGITGGLLPDWIRIHDESVAEKYDEASSWGLPGQQRSAEIYAWLSSLDAAKQGQLCLELALFTNDSQRAMRDASPDGLMIVARAYGVDEAQLRAEAEHELDNPEAEIAPEPESEEEGA